jgi:hypothetical protein
MQFCRDKTQELQARTLSASRDGDGSLDGKLIEMSKNELRHARVRLPGSTVAKDVANFSNYFLFLERGDR